MCRRALTCAFLLLLCWVYPGSARAFDNSHPHPLICPDDDDGDRHDRDDRHDGYGRDDRDDDRDHRDRDFCPRPNQCQVRTSDHCVRGHCPPIVNAPDGTACDDGNRHTHGDVCTQGVCGAPPTQCPDDGNPCTTAVRQANGTCVTVNVANGTSCGDGNACTSGDACTNGVCAGAPVQCPADGGNPCRIGICQAGGTCGFVNAADGISCSDGNACTTGDVCTGGVCAGAPKQCPDTGNPCTAAVCRSDGSCGAVNVADGTSCNDGNGCTTADACAQGVCRGAAVQCPADTGNPCTVGVCKPDGSCGSTNVADGTACEDGDACTTGSTCQAGACGGGGTLTCSSPTDTCAAPGGCATDCGPGGCLVAGSGFGNPTLTIPSGALATTVRIKVTDLGGDPTDASVFHVYDLSPSGTVFALPATVDLPAPPLAPGHTAVIEVSSGGGWVAVPTTLAGGRVSGPIAHFSQCRTRDVAPSLTAGLVVEDMWEFQDVGQLPPDPGCTPGFDSFGICVKVRNPTAATVTTATARINGWQCYNGLFNFTGPGGFEGEHCDASGLLIPCGFADVPVNLPGGLAPGASATVQYPLDALGFCFDGSAFVGIDFTFREPTPADRDAGMRSANDGPFVGGGLFQGVTPKLKAGATRPIKNFLIDARF
jgi:hypothetical protein